MGLRRSRDQITAVIHAKAIGLGVALEGGRLENDHVKEIAVSDVDEETVVAEEVCPQDGYLDIKEEVP